MLILYHPDCKLHRTVELLGGKIIPALESPERLDAILKALTEDGTHELHIEPYSPWNADDDPQPNQQDDLVKRILKDTHEAGYIRHLQTVHKRWVTDGLINEDEHVLPECFRVPSLAGGIPKSQSPPFERPPPRDIYAQSGYYAFDMSTGIAKGTWASILASANLAAQAPKYLIREPDATAQKRKAVLALCRPPGHHCTTAMAGGYCYANNSAVAIAALRRRQRSVHPAHGPRRPRPERAAGGKVRVALLDLDFHHGNGSQDAFYADPSTLYVSIHGEHEYPYYTGFESETGDGAGSGYNLNLPLRVDASWEEYEGKLDAAVKRIVEFAPEFLVVSLGFDTFRLDPIGKFDIDVGDYERMAAKVRGTKELRNVPSVILLEGGYVVDKLGECMIAFLRGWEKEDKVDKG